MTAIPPPCQVHTRKRQPGCPDCRAHRAAVDRHQYRMRAYGQPTRLLVADTIAHLRQLLRSGLNPKRIAELADVDSDTVWRIVHGKTTKVTVRVHQALLGVIVGERSPNSLRPSIGVTRRVQALMAAGWPTSVIAKHLGICPGEVGRHRYGHHRTVTQRRHLEVVRVYDRLCRHMIETGRPGPSQRARAMAKRLGYAPPGAWDDDLIDDPEAQPWTPPSNKAEASPGQGAA